MLKNIKKAQVSTEFLIFVSMSVVLLMVYMAIANNFLNIAYKQKEIISAQDLAKILRNEFNLASRVENGYIKEFQLPYQVDYQDYFIDIPPNGREISISYVDDPEIDFVELLSTNVNVIGSVLQPGNTIFIKKYNDNVFVSSPYCVGLPPNYQECITSYEDCQYSQEYGFGFVTYSVPACLRTCMTGSPNFWSINAFCDNCDGDDPPCGFGNDGGCVGNSQISCSSISPSSFPCFEGVWVIPNDPCLYNTNPPGLYLCCDRN